MSASTPDRQHLLPAANEASPLTSPTMGGQSNSYGGGGGAGDFPSDQLLGTSPSTGYVSSQEPEPAPLELSTATCSEKVDKARQWAIAGLGMFANAYVVLALGNIEPILAHSNPECWSKNATACDKVLRSSTHYAVFAGMFVGMVGGGLISDAKGRRFSSLLSAFGMTICLVLLTSSYGGEEVDATFGIFTACLGLFGLFLGGEYPSAAAAAAEKSEAEREARAAAGLPEQASNRGAQLVSNMAMQGAGALANSLVVWLLIIAFGQTERSGYDQGDLKIIWRLQYGLGLLPLLFICVYRYKYLEESGSWEKMRARQTPEAKTIFRQYYWHRMLGTAGGWCCWDLSFYSIKVFQAQFVKLFTPNADIDQLLLELLLLNAITTVGYIFAAVFIDSLGRKRMQLVGFTTMTVAFTIIAVWFDQLQSSSGGLVVLRLLFYASQIFGQFVNASTFVLPAEMYPTHMRALAHGMSGACGPGLGGALGALIVSLLSSRASFFFSAGVSVLGALLTTVFIPDLAKPECMSLEENDRFWQNVLQVAAGRAPTHDMRKYSQHSSWFERVYWFDAVLGPVVSASTPSTLEGRSRRELNSTLADDAKVGESVGRQYGGRTISDLDLGR